MEKFIEEPFVLVDNDYSIACYNESVINLFGNPKGKKCYEYFYNSSSPCEQKSCPLRRENFNSQTFIRHIKDGKFLVKVSKREKEVLYRFFPLSELIELIKDYDFQPSEKDGNYISKRDFERLITDLLNRKEKFYIISINLEKLKYINEVYGISAGDIIVREIEKKLKELSKYYNFKYTQIQIGFFLVLLPDNLSLVEQLEKDLLKHIGVIKVRYLNTTLKSRVYITTLNIDPNRVKTIQNLYKLIFYAEKIREDALPMKLTNAQQEEVLNFLRTKEVLMEHLQTALEQKQITYYLQPIVKMSDKTISHFEVLMRLIENGQVVSIGKYIDLIYEYNLIPDFDEKLLEVLEQDLDKLKKLKKPIFVNISSEALKLFSYRKKLSKFLKSASEKGVKVFFEITEQALFGEWVFLEKLAKEFVLKFAIDDFGTGYSSFKMVTDLISKKVGNILKIDASIIKEYNKNKNTKALVDAIITFAKEANVEVVGEGIENEELYNALKRAGLTYGQGWYFYKPMPLKEALELVKV